MLQYLFFSFVKSSFLSAICFHMGITFISVYVGHCSGDDHVNVRCIFENVVPFFLVVSFCLARVSLAVHDEISQVGGITFFHHFLSYRL